jgi:hypothetical protein
MRRIFILSPAKSSGERADLLYNPAARFDLARRLRAPAGVPLGEVFSFLSGLYFRGKLAYASTFANAPRGVPGVLVITTNRGLLPVDVPVSIEQLQAFGQVPVDPRDDRYLAPLLRDASLLAKVIGPKCQVVFLGSISSDRYVEPLLGPLGSRLHFPPAFLGRGDMSRGGLLLRAAADKNELEYAPLAGALRHGKRPERLAPRRWGFRVLEGTTDLMGATSQTRAKRPRAKTRVDKSG